MISLTKKQLLSERKQLMKIAGLLEIATDLEEDVDSADENSDDLEEDSDYDQGTPSGDTDTMNIG